MCGAGEFTQEISFLDSRNETNNCVYSIERHLTIAVARSNTKEISKVNINAWCHLLID